MARSCTTRTDRTIAVTIFKLNPASAETTTAGTDSTLRWWILVQNALKS